MVHKDSLDLLGLKVTTDLLDYKVRQVIVDQQVLKDHKATPGSPDQLVYKVLKDHKVILVTQDQPVQ